MAKFRFSTASLIKLDSCHIDLQKVLHLAISRSDVDFGISEGHRTIERQKELYAIGRTVDLHKGKVTNIDGVTKLGKHNYFPSKAVDIYVYHPEPIIRKKITFDQTHLAYIVGVIISCSKELYEKGEMQHLVKSGINWDSDGILMYDQSFQDLPHIEIVE